MKQHAFLMVILVLASALIYVACRKDKLFPGDPEITLLQEQQDTGCKTFVRGTGSSTKNSSRSDQGDTPKRMVLGAQKPNPFARSIMTQAYNKIYEPDVAQVPHTHLYVRFLPADIEQLSRLGELDDTELFDFPLDREIIEPGDYWHDPTIPEGQFTWLYAVVKPDFVFPPGIQHEVLEYIVNAPFKSKLTREAFRIAYGTATPGIGSPAEVKNREYEECAWDCNYYPECFELPQFGCGGNVGGNGGGTGGGTTFFPGDEIPCEITDPNWPNCEDLPVVTSVTNGCGCQVNASTVRYPGGCVRVVDTQLPANGSLPNGTPAHLDGVKQAKITWWNGWFGIWSTHTDNNGCWQIHEADYGVGHMWVTFKNSRAKIRGIRGANIFEYPFAVKDYIGQIAGPVFNNISVIYNTGGAVNSASLLFWYAATSNNALWEYYNYASADGIALPPGNLKILLTNYANNSGAAPMLEKTGFNWVAAGGITALVGMVFRNPFVIIPVTALSGYFAAFAPDVVYNYRNSTPSSDVVKEVLYHEFAHTSHYACLSPGVRDAYWGSNIAYIFNNVLQSSNPPFGVRGASGFQRCAIVEMWAWYIGPLYADRKYGLLHSRGAGNPFFLEIRRWLYFNEPFIPDVLGNPNPDAYIP